MSIEIEFNGVTFSYDRKRKVLDEFSIKLSKPETGSIVYSFIGKSGCGKSTILKLAAGLLEPSNGQIRCSIDNFRYGYLSQVPVLFDHLSVEENALYLASQRENESYFDKRLYDDLVTVLRLDDLLTDKSRKLDSLSGGEKQRIALLQIVCIKPDVLLLDEPCNGLDTPTKRDFLLSVLTAVQKIDSLVLYVTHHTDEVNFVSDQVCFIDENGEIVFSGKLDEAQRSTKKQLLAFFHHPYFSTVYQGVESRNIYSSKPVELNYHELALLGNRVQFSGDVGIKYSVIKKSDGFSIIQTVDSPMIVIATDKMPKGKYVNLDDALVKMDGI